MNGVQGHVPLIGQQEAAQQAAASQLFLGLFVPLIPHVTQYRLAHGYVTDGGFDVTDATPERIADEAWQIADAAMRRLGFASKK
ncbi:MAG: hypothetical protein LLG00_16650 [Planctomycetaceae bacterium]|nr:hypothetical protein [Planctomycetaceae bacterium]